MNINKRRALELAAMQCQSDALLDMFTKYPDSNANYWAVVDFNLSSAEERLFIFDLKAHSFKSFLVSHGKNSGEEFATHFSNEINSNCSSLGIFKTLDIYEGKHGTSLKVEGLEKSNSNAETRYIVIHSADYVVSDYKGTGRAGRSEGCFAVNPDFIDEVIDCLRDGSYLNAWHS